MTKQEEMKKEILSDSEVDKKLKKYFQNMIKFAGEDYALISLSSEESVKDSIATFTSKFDDVSDVEILCSLIKGAILSSERLKSNLVVRKFITAGNLEDLVILADENLGFRRALTKTFMKQCYNSNEETFNKKKKEGNALGNLITMEYFEEELKRNKVKRLIKDKSISA